MSSIRAESFTLDATGEVIATGEYATASAPNELTLRVTAGDALIGGASADALFPLGSTDGPLALNLSAGEELFAKSSAGATLILLRTKGN